MTPDRVALRTFMPKDPMLACDSVTVAAEVPVWLRARDLEALEQTLGVVVPQAWKKLDDALTGHIDFLQVRNGFVHILDYKPDARTNRPIEQLALYALALAHLGGVPLASIKCAWFNEEEYCEFFPGSVFGIKTARPVRAVSSRRVSRGEASARDRRRRRDRSASADRVTRRSRSRWRRAA